MTQNIIVHGTSTQITLKCIECEKKEKSLSVVKHTDSDNNIDTHTHAHNTLCMRWHYQNFLLSAELKLKMIVLAVTTRIDANFYHTYGQFNWNWHENQKQENRFH